MFTVATVCGAQAPAIPRSALNGEWTGTLVLDNSSPKLSVVFALTDTAFAGKVYVDGGLFGTMQDGSLNGSTVHFKVDRLDFTGVITGTRMKVDLIVFNGTTKQFTLTRVPDNPKDSAAILAHRRVALLDRHASARVGSRGAAETRRDEGGRLELHNHLMVNDQVCSKPFDEHHPFILEANERLSLNMKALLLEGACQYGFINRFQQARTEVAMNSDCRVNDRLSDVVEFLALDRSGFSPRLRGSARHHTSFVPGANHHLDATRITAFFRHRRGRDNGA